MTRTLDEVRLELADVKHSLKSTQVSLRILEEQCRSYDNTLALFESKNPQVDQLESHIALLESKLAQIEKFQDKVLNDLRALNAHSRQQIEQMKDLEQEMHFQKTRLGEVDKLKSSLHAVAQVMEKNGKAGMHSGKHKVVAGDTLDKIAKRYGVHVDSIKKMNHLKSDHIKIGQEIVIPYE